MTGPVWRLGDRYRVIERIGAGGMAEVFRAHDELLARDVAVKVFRSVPVEPDTAFRIERQHAELHALAGLNHPNLITLFDGSITHRPAYLVIELIDGQSLAQRIADAPLPEQEVREIGGQIAEALAYVHAAGMVHRDVKPANILLGIDRAGDSSTMRARLSDFGIVRLLDSEGVTGVGSTLGTASYLAPEQTRGSSVGPPADVYALGLTLIEALSGIRSFDGPPLEAAMARLTSDPVIPAQLPAPWPALLQAMTARDPAVRPTAAQVAQLLRADDADGRTALLGPAPPSAATTASLPALEPVAPAGMAAMAALPPGPPPEPAQRAVGRRRGVTGWLLAAAVVVVALAIGGVLLLLPSAHDGSGSPTDSPAHPRGTHSSRATGPQGAVQNSDTRRSGDTTGSPPTHRHSQASSGRPSSSTSDRGTPSASTSTSRAPSTSPAPSTSASSTSPSATKSSSPGRP